MKNNILKILSNINAGIASGKERAWEEKSEQLHEDLKELAFDLLVHSGAQKITIPFDVGSITIEAAENVEVGE